MVRTVIPDTPVRITYEPSACIIVGSGCDSVMDVEQVGLVAAACARAAASCGNWR